MAHAFPEEILFRGRKRLQPGRSSLSSDRRRLLLLAVIVLDESWRWRRLRQLAARM